MKKIYILSIIIVLLFILIPKLSAPIYYSEKQINDLIEKSKNGDSKGLIKLYDYYLDRQEKNNLILIGCKMNQNKVMFESELQFIKNIKNCPKQPLDKLNNNSFLNYIRYIWFTGKLPTT